MPIPGFPLSRERRVGWEGRIAVLSPRYEVPACAGMTGWAGTTAGASIFEAITEGRDRGLL